MEALTCPTADYFPVISETIISAWAMLSQCVGIKEVESIERTLLVDTTVWSTGHAADVSIFDTSAEPVSKGSVSSYACA